MQTIKLKWFSLVLFAAFLFVYTPVTAHAANILETPSFTSGGTVYTDSFSSGMRSSVIGDYESPSGSGCPTFRYHSGSYPSNLAGTAIFLGNCALFSAHTFQYLFDYPQAVVMSGAGAGDYWFSLGTSSATMYYWSAHFDGTYWTDMGTTSSASRIISVDTPQSGGVSPTPSVPFSINYFYNDADDFSIVGIAISDVTLGITYLPSETPIISSGGSNFSPARLLNPYSLILARPYLRNSSSTNFVYGDFITFSVVSAASSSQLTARQRTFAETLLGIGATTTNFLAAITGSSTAPFSDFSGLNLIWTKFPFNLISEIGALGDAYSAGYHSTTSSHKVEASFPGTTTKLTLFDLDAVAVYPFVGTIRTLLAAALWVAFVLSVFKSIFWFI